MNESKKALAVAHLDRMVKEGRYLDCGAHISLPVLHSLKIASDALKERKTGKWEVKLMRHFAHLLICSNCGADINITAEEHLEYYKRNFRYCPYCGAKMEVDE